MSILGRRTIIAGFLITAAVFGYFYLNVDPTLQRRLPSASEDTKSERAVDLPPNNVERIDGNPNSNNVSIFLEGRVVDEGGNGLDSAEIIVDCPVVVLGPVAKRKEYTATADSSGKFKVSIARDEVDIILFVTAEGFARDTRRIHVPKGGLKDVEIALQRSGSIAGNVFDVNHLPVPYTFVEARRADTDLHIAYESESSTGSDGAFLISPVSPGSYTLCVRYLPPGSKRGWPGGIPVETDEGVGFGGGLVTVVLKPGEKLRDVNIVLPWNSKRAIEGIVVDEFGEPVSGAIVWADISGSSGTPFGICTMATNLSGRFRIEYLREAGDPGEPRLVNVKARAEGYEEGIAESVEVNSHDARIRLAKSRSGTISGVVIDSTTKSPITNASVCLYNVKRDGGGDWSNPNIMGDKYRSKVSRTGRFSVREVPTGSATLKAYAPGYGFSTPEKVSVLAGETTHIEINLVPEGKLEVNVKTFGVLTGTRFSDFWLVCWPCDQFGDPGATIDYNQHEEMRGYRISPDFSNPGVRLLYLQPGRYAVVVLARPTSPDDVWLRGAMITAYGEAEVETGKTTQMDFSLGGSSVVTGYLAPEHGEKLTVTLAAGGDVSPFPGDKDIVLSALPTVGSYMTYRLSEPGSFLFLGVPEGTYTAILSATSANNPAPRLVASKTIEVTGSDELTLEFP